MQFLDCCPICGARPYHVFYLPFRDLLGSGLETYEQMVAICHTCGFIFTQNPFTEEQLRNRYASFSKFEYDAENHLGGLKEWYIRQCKRQKNFIDETLGENGYSSIFEVGCASGYNLGLYCSKKLSGVEPSKLNCKLAKRNYQLELFCGMWEDFYLQEKIEHFDLLFLSMVLEHVVDPRTFLEQCVSKLSSQYVFIEVPTLDYKFMDEPFGMMCEEHVNIFTLESLVYLMRSLQYELMNCEMIFAQHLFLPAGYPSLMTVWNKTKAKNLYRPMLSSEEIFVNYVMKSRRILQEIDEKIRRIPKDEKLGLWGVGHHISMLYANTSLKEKNIVRVYDSDERKQGILIFGCKIKRFDMEDIVTKNIEAVLITTYTAQKAIINSLKFVQEKITIYTLYDI